MFRLDLLDRQGGHCDGRIELGRLKCVSIRLRTNFGSSRTRYLTTQDQVARYYLPVLRIDIYRKPIA